MRPKRSHCTLALLSACALGAREARGQTMMDAGEPFGMLPLIDEIDPSNASDPHPRQELPANASSTTMLLGRSARVIAPSTDEARAVAYRIGAGRGLVAGRAYLLVVDYPDDAPRTIVVLNRGADQARALTTGTAIGDYREQYAYPNPESLRYPHSNQWRQFRSLFYLHDRTQGVVGVRNDSDQRRPEALASGFWVAIGQFNARGNPREQGAAFGRIRLFEVTSAERFDLAVRYPPSPLPRRHTFWREEMGDGTAMCLSGNAMNCEPATADPLTWLEHKMRLARFLGINTFARDLLEFGFNQGWDSAPHGGNNWFYQSRFPQLWERAVDRATALGLEVLPYFEYTGATGAPAYTATDCPSEDSAGNAVCASRHDARHRCAREYFGGGSRLRCALPTYGFQHHCHPLAERDQYTGIFWVEDRCADITDPAALEDLRNVLDASIVRLRARGRFAGAWLRTRPTSMPMSFATETLARFSMEANGGRSVTRADLRANSALLGQYYRWWFGKRRAFLLAVRDYLRSSGLPDASVLFTPSPQEGLPTRFEMDRVATDDPAGWEALNQMQGVWHWRYGPVDWSTFTADHRFARAITELTAAQGLEEANLDYANESLHSAPPADIDSYASDPGVLVTAPFNRLFTVEDSALGQRFRSPTGLAMVRHFPLNEDDGTGNAAMDRSNGSFNNWPMSGRFGYFATDVDRGGDHTMLAEARAVANADPTWLGYLASSSFSRGAPEHVRAFNAAFLALPALASRRIEGASSDAAVVVRAIDTPSNGTYYAIVNTAMTAKNAVRITIDGAAPITDLVTGAAVARPVTLDLSSGQLVALLASDAPSTADASTSDATITAADATTSDASAPVDRDASSAMPDASTPPSTAVNCACRAQPTAHVRGSFALALFAGAMAITARRRRPR